MLGQLLLIRTTDLAVSKICTCLQMTLHQSELSRYFRYILEVFYNYILRTCVCDAQTCEERGEMCAHMSRIMYSEAGGIKLLLFLVFPKCLWRILVGIVY